MFFYCIALYYECKAQFEENTNQDFDYNSFYVKKSEYRKDITSSFANLFLTMTIEIIKNETAGNANVGNWIRNKKSQELFMRRLRNELSVNFSYANRYKEFEDKFKIISTSPSLIF